MKVRIAGLALALVYASSARAALLVYESFAYPAGAILTNQPGWVASGSGSGIQAAEGNLAVAGLQPSSGNCVMLGGGGASARVSFLPQSSDTFYSFAFRITDPTTLSSTGGYFASFNDNFGNLGAVVWLRSRAPGRYDLGGSMGPTASIQWNTNAGAGFDASKTMFLIVGYEVRSGFDNDVMNLWFFEDPYISSTFLGGMEIASAIQVSQGPNLAQVSGFTITQLSSTPTPTMLFDELRVGHSFGEVSPPTQAHLMNSSSRGWVTNGTNSLSVDITVSKGQPKRFLIRALGPSLASSGVPNVLINPTIEMLSGHDLLATNHNWQSTQAAEIFATGLAPSDLRESAIIVTLSTGSYTAIVQGERRGSGNALLEVFELP